MTTKKERWETSFRVSKDAERILRVTKETQSKTVKKIQSHQKQTQNDAKRKKRIKKTHSVKTLPKRYKSEAQDHKEKLNNTKKPQRDFKRLETEYSLKTSPKISKRPGKRKTQGWISQNNNNKKALDHFIL